MNSSLILLAGALASRPSCTGSRLALAAGCVHPNHTARRLATHPEIVR